MKWSLFVCAHASQIYSGDELNYTEELICIEKMNICNLYQFSSLVCCVQREGAVLGWKKLLELSRGILFWYSLLLAVSVQPDLSDDVSFTLPT